jgi:arginyl-tRNA synthetase
MLKLKELEVKKELKQAILSALNVLEIAEMPVKLERPQHKDHGDWSTNVAMVAANQAGTNPRELAQKLVVELEKDPGLKSKLSKVEVAGPGFINFTLTNEYYFQNLLQINENYGGNRQEEKLRIVVEMGDPNTHKLPHIGHLFNYIVGDSTARIYSFLGNDIYRCSWQGDVGPHVAKALYGWKKRGKKDPIDIVKRMQELQDSYVLGARSAEDDEEAAAEIKKINKQIYQQDPEVYEDWKLTKQWSIEFDEYFEAKLGVKLDNRYLEGDQWKRGVELVKQNIGKVFEESQGAIVFKGEKYGLHTRVFLTKEGTPTYEAKELGLDTQKMLDFPYDLTIIPTAHEQNGFFKVVFKAMELAIPELEGKFVHIGTGMIQLSSGKMSSRTGKIISGPDLVNAVEARVKEIVSSREGLSDEEKEEITHKVSIGAVKYAFLKSNIFQDSAFDLEESVSFDGNSGPYLQYTYARIRSVLRTEVVENNKKDSKVNFTEDSEWEVIKHLEQFPEIIEAAAASYTPHLIATFLFELAQKFNSFYKTYSINSAESPEIIASRRFLAEQTATILKTGLNLLGIETLEKM